MEAFVALGASSLATSPRAERPRSRGFSCRYPAAPARFPSLPRGASCVAAMAEGGRGNGGSLRIAKDKTTLSEELGVYVCEAATAAAKAGGKFTVALSGGSLPKLLASGVLEPQRSREANFPAWHVYFADERVVPLDHEDSNYKLAKDTLFDKASIPSAQIFPIDASLSVDDCAKEYAEKVKAGLGDGTPVFDLLLLGLGEDGHTCSLFPGHELLKETRLTVAPVTDSPKPPLERITLTLPVLNAARRVAFVAAGAGKKDVIREIFQSVDCALPAAMVKPADGELLWFLDDDAAKEIEK